MQIVVRRILPCAYENGNNLQIIRKAYLKKTIEVMDSLLE
jgi:hypothetical protein